MKTFRKIVFIILALIPCISLILCSFFFIGGNLQNFEGSGDLVTQLITSPVKISKSNTSYAIAPQSSDIPFTMIDQALLYSSNALGMFNRVSSGVGVLYYLQDAGVLITTPMVFAANYLWYVFVIYIVDMIISLLTFVPRKCSEFLTKGLN